MKSLKFLFAVLAMSVAILTPALRAQDGPPGGKGGRGGAGIEQLKEHLSLTDAQVAKITSIMDAQKKELDALRDDTSTDKEGKMTKRRDIMAKYHGQIRAELTPEQQAKFDAMRPGGGKGKGGKPKKE